MKRRVREEKGKAENIRVVIDIPGIATEAHEYEHCPINRHGTHRVCPIGGGKCHYGLSEIRPPRRCPMRMGKFLQPVKMKFSIVERAIEDE